MSATATHVEEQQPSRLLVELPFREAIKAYAHRVAKIFDWAWIAGTLTGFAVAVVGGLLEAARNGTVEGVRSLFTFEILLIGIVMVSLTLYFAVHRFETVFDLVQEVVAKLMIGIRGGP